MKCWARTARQDSPFGSAQGRLGRAGVHLLGVLALLLGGAASVLSQETTFHSQTNVVVIPALVKSAKGEVVYGLGAKDFLVEDDGVEQAVRLDEAAEGSAVSVVVAIQRGRRANYEFPRIRGLSAMLDPLMAEGRGRVAIVEFDSQVQLVQDFTSSSDKTAQTLARRGEPPHADVFVTTNCFAALGKSPESLMCHFSRSIQKIDGESPWPTPPVSCHLRRSAIRDGSDAGRVPAARLHRAQELLRLLPERPWGDLPYASCI